MTPLDVSLVSTVNDLNDAVVQEASDRALETSNLQDGCFYTDYDGVDDNRSSTDASLKSANKWTLCTEMYLDSGSAINSRMMGNLAGDRCIIKWPEGHECIDELNCIHRTNAQAIAYYSNPINGWNLEEII